MTEPANPLISRVREIEERLSRGRLKVSRRIAVFDLDDTLLEGDIGDAVFAELKRKESQAPLTVEKKRLPLEWQQYRSLIREGKKEEAYRQVVTCMAGIPRETVVETTRSLIRDRPGPIEIQGENLPVPRANPDMIPLIRLLKKLKYHIMIISASNHFSVRVAAVELLKLPGSRAFGIRPRLSYVRDSSQSGRTAILTGRLCQPVPWARGKAELYHRLCPGIAPLITGGDSRSDLFLLDLTHPQGLAIWAARESSPPPGLFPLYNRNSI
jgi:phosphoserine phosphatase